MKWTKEDFLETEGLLAGASINQIESVERELHITFPHDFREFLLYADGGHIAQKRFIIYSVGEGLHPAETLLAANKRQESDFPLLLFGRDAWENFGFLKEDLSGEFCPVYMYLHEEEEVVRIADSFKDFVKWMFARK